MQRNIMDIKDFIRRYHNYPVLFIGTGFSLRYLNNSFTWDNLLKKISTDIYDSEEKYYDIKAKYIDQNNSCDYALVATELENEFNKKASENRGGKFQEINDIYYENLQRNYKVSRFKIYISNLLNKLDIKNSEQIGQELNSLEQAKKNVSSIITTNYDQLIESIFNFTPLISNDIVLKNPYGSVYKIHGCVTNPSNIIITSTDYDDFDKKYEFIKAQLLSIFIHNPIIFIGYSISDDNIKNLLKTIFSNIQPNSDESKKIRDNFLLIEYEKDGTSRDVIEHDIDLPINGTSTIVRINKIRTDKYSDIYNEIANLVLPISAMEIRRVQSILKKITSGEAPELIVKFANDIDETNNNDMVIAIGTKDSISVKETIQFVNTQDLLTKYFEIIKDRNESAILSLNKTTISKAQYFPVFGFSNICNNLNSIDNYKENQKNNLAKYLNSISNNIKKTSYSTIQKIINDRELTQSSLSKIIFWNVFNDNIGLSTLKRYLQKEITINTDYRRLICLYDFMSYANEPLVKPDV